MRRVCLLLIAAFITSYSFAQEINNVDVVITPSLQEDGELPYSEAPLTWKNFKGKPDNSCQYIAMTYSGIKMKYEYKTRNGVTTARVLVCPYMDIEHSWYKKEGYNDPTLEHEQRHFDITAIVANEFAEELKSKSFTLASFPSEMKKMHQKYIDRLAEMQKKYDDETDHGVKPDQQAAWDQQLKEEIRKALSKG